MAVGDFNEDGTLKVRSVSAKGGDIWGKTTDDERIEFQTIRNGYALANGGANWNFTAGARLIALAGTVGVDEIDAAIAAGFDISTVATPGLIYSVTENQRDAAGILTYRGYEPDAWNEFSFAFSGVSFGLNGRVLPAGTPIPWVQVVVNIGADDFANRYLMMIRIDQADFVDDVWMPLNDTKEFSFSAAYRKQRRISTGNLRLIAGSHLLRRIEIKRDMSPGAVPFGGFYEVSLLVFCAGEGLTASIGFYPSAVPGDADPVILGQTNGVVAFDLPNTPVGGKILTRLVTGFANRSEVSPIGEIETIRNTVKTVRVDVQAATSKVASLATKVNELEPLDASKDDVVPPDKPTWVLGGWWKNTGTVPVTLPDIAGITETWLGANNFVKVTGGTVTNASGDEVFVSTENLDGKDVVGTAEIGIWRAAGVADVIFRIENAKWVENKLPAVTAPITPLRDITVPVPYWNAAAAAVGTNGSLLVRNGETNTVSETTVLNNGFEGSWQHDHTFSAADRGKTLLYRSAIPAASLTARIAVAARNSAQGVIGDYGMSYVNGAWAATGGATVTIDKGMAVLEISVPFSASLDTVLYTWMTPGTVQQPCLYEVGKAAVAVVERGLRLTASDGTRRDYLDEDKAAVHNRLTAVEGKLSVTSPIMIVSAITKSGGDATLIARDRNGASLSNLAFIFRDNRTIAVGDAKLVFPARNAAVSIPVAAFQTETLAGFTYNAAMSPDGVAGVPPRKTFWRSYTFDGVVYRIYVQWERVDGEWRFWFQGWHSSSWNLTGIADLTATYTIDNAAIDPAFSSFAKAADVVALENKVDAIPAGNKGDKGDPGLDGAKGDKGDRGPAAKYEGAGVKVWSISGLAITGGTSIPNTNTAGLTADIDGPFNAIVVNAPPAPAAILFTVDGLIAGKDYEIRSSIGSALAIDMTFEAGVTMTSPDYTATTKVTSSIAGNERIFRHKITATGTTYSGTYSLSHSTDLHGPAAYTLSETLLVADQDGIDRRAALPSEIPALVNLAAYAKLTDIKQPVLPWTANEVLPGIGVTRFRAISLTRAVMYYSSASPRTCGAAFDAAEAGNWTLFGQSATPLFSTGAVYPGGFKVLNNGVLHERNSAGGPSAWAAADWKALAATPTGRFMGFGTTFAGLPTTNGIAPAITGDWAILTAQDGTRAPGLYVMNVGYTFYTAFPGTAAVNYNRVVVEGQSTTFGNNMNEPHPAGGTLKSYILANENSVVEIEMANTTLADIRTIMELPDLAAVIRSDIGTWPYLDTPAAVIPKGRYGVRMFATNRIAFRPLVTPPSASFTPNLAAENFGTLNGADSTRVFIRNRQGARISGFVFTFRDRRGGAQAGRNIAVNFPASEMRDGGTWGNIRADGSPARQGLYRNFTMPDNSIYGALLQYSQTPGGLQIWLQDWHADVWNGYGQYENFTVNWE